jgi:hypothetical protein
MTSVQEFIESKGGFFVNIVTENRRTFAVFECENGHLNQKRVDTIIGAGKTGRTWCMRCTSNGTG